MHFSIYSRLLFVICNFTNAKLGRSILDMINRGYEKEMLQSS